MEALFFVFQEDTIKAQHRLEVCIYWTTEEAGVPSIYRAHEGYGSAFRTDCNDTPHFVMNRRIRSALFLA
jgi:hypothetical protein